jgi:hypothetical protein
VDSFGYEGEYMTAMNTTQVLAACKWLEEDFKRSSLGDENEQNEKIYQLNHVPQLSDELSRGRTIVYPVPRMSEWVTNVINQVISYSTFPVLTPMGGFSPTDADKLEASIALGLAEVNEGQQLAKAAYRGFLKDTHVVYQCVTGNPEDAWPFSVDLPKFSTCFFERFGGGRPKALARSYDMLVSAAEKKYSGLKGEHDGSMQKASYDEKSGFMRYTPLSGEMKHDNKDGIGEMTDIGRIVHIEEYYDEEYCYHCCKGKDGAEQTLYRAKTVVGGVPFFVVPSSPQGAQKWREDWRPIGWSLYTRILQIERIETIRATRAEHVQDHIIARLPPDQQEAVQKLRAGGYTPVLHGGVNFLPLAAEEVVMWSQVPDADLEKRSIELKEEMERFIASWSYPATENTISQANVGTAQIGMQVVHQQESGLLSCHTRGMAAMAEMMACGLAGAMLKDGRELYAKDEVAYGRNGGNRVVPGKSVALSAELAKKIVVYGKDRNVRIEVVTRSETESELQQREAGVWNNIQRGSQAFDEYIAVRNPNVTAQHDVLAKDSIRKSLGAVYGPAIPQIAAKRNLERWGVDLDRIIADAAMQQQGAIAGQSLGAAGGSSPGGGTTVMQAAPPTGGGDVSSFGGAAQAPMQ